MESDSSCQFSMLSSDPPSPFHLDKAIEKAIEEKTLPSTEEEAEEALEQFDTNVERIRHFYGKMKEQDNMLPTRADVKFEKDESLADEVRERGKRDPNYPKALESFNESLCLAPSGSKAMALGYANRSLIFAKTRFYNFALQNIQLALDNNNLPKEKMPKLIKRKNKVLRKMKTEKDSYELYGLEDEIQLSHEKNQQIPVLVNGLEWACNDVYGRHMVTTRDLAPGDVVVLEDPFLTVTFKQFAYRSCYNCTAHNFYNLIPCPKSTRVMFCSEACAKNAWERFYKYEYLIVDGLFHWVSNSFPARATFKAFTAFDEDPAELKGLFKPGTENAFECDFRNADERTKFRLFNSMATNHESRCKLDTLRIIYNCATIFHITKEWSDFKSVLEDKELETLFLELLVRFQEIGLTNNFDIIEPFKRKKQVVVYFSGKGMAQGNYLMSSVFAHSCAPNVAVISANQRGRQTVVVLHPIKAGDVIFITYGPSFTTHDRDVRQHFFKARYQFDCKCVACEDVARFSILPSSNVLHHVDSGNAIFKIRPDTCPFDEETQAFAEQARREISEYISSNYDKYPGEAIDVYEGYLIETVIILAFKKPIDLIFSRKRKEEKCLPC